VHFADDLAESVAFGDARYGEFCDLIRKTCSEGGVEAPELPQPAPFHAQPPLALQLREFAAVIFTSGFRPDYSRWVDVPGGFDDLGFPVQIDGASTVAPGLFFCGVHFLRKRKSSLLGGVGEDATIVARQVAELARPRT
jgi:putative flavoprotein involved in K+ transport